MSPWCRRVRRRARADRPVESGPSTHSLVRASVFDTGMTAAAVTRVEVFADIVCPFTHVGLRRFVEARAARPSAVRLRVRAWPLEWVNGRPLSPETAAREIDSLRELVAPDLFAGFDPSSFPTTSVPAFGLVAAAYVIGDPTGEAVSLAV